ERCAPSTYRYHHRYDRGSPFDDRSTGPEGAPLARQGGGNNERAVACGFRSILYENPVSDTPPRVVERPQDEWQARRFRDCARAPAGHGGRRLHGPVRDQGERVSRPGSSTERI